MKKIIFKLRDNIYLTKEFIENAGFFFHDDTVKKNKTVFGSRQYTKSLNKFLYNSKRTRRSHFLLTQNEVIPQNVTVENLSNITAFLDFIRFLQQNTGFLQVEYLFNKNNPKIINKLYNEYEKRVLEGGDEQPNALKFEDNPTPYYFVNFYNYFSIIVNDTSDKCLFEDILNRIEPLLPHKNDFKSFCIELAYLSNDIVSTSTDSKITNNNFDDFLNLSAYKNLPCIDNEKVIISSIEVGGINLNYCKKGLDLKIIYPKKILNLEKKTTVKKFFKKRFGAKILQHADKTLETIYTKMKGRGYEYRVSIINAWEHEHYKYPESAFIETICNKYNKTRNNVTENGSIILFEISTMVEDKGQMPVQVEPAIFEIMCLAHFFKQIIIEPAGNDNNEISDSISENLKSKFNYKSYGESWFEIQDLKLNNLIVVSEADKSKIDEKIQKTEYLNSLFCKTFVPLEMRGIRRNYQNNEIEPSILVGASEFKKAKTIKFIHKSGTNYDKSKRILKVYGYGGGVLFKNGETYEVTSAASAIVAGFASRLQAIAKANEFYISPVEMKYFLQMEYEGNQVYGEGNSILGYVPNFLKVGKIIQKKILDLGKSPFRWIAQKEWNDFE